MTKQRCSVCFDYATTMDIYSLLVYHQTQLVNHHLIKYNLSSRILSELFSDI